ncbi:MAG TPA: methylmalonyl Co-A mutase-associated GTPase MeaB [Candidatus Poseidoniales archaeon]|nr:MAG: methylmalonyl Co-A mutase-associated GTPase MeaB [Euryarchaeota archaeon]HIE81925.1 methylmalonyl Co-A mutase-associated GTPase MeaB [Candidatus Poseidoniales archaeon]HIL50306.1 methylmalonyl Co-A mutase-associated GTPase MeaB [Candidatus Poseidoniales archaeon]
MSETDELLIAAKNGDRRALSKLLTCLEEGEESPVPAGSGDSIGVTGPPGVGKSTLIGRMVDIWVARGETVAVLAVDPSSPRSGGALLGDRMRMMSADSSDSFFVRSLATRNHPGGLMDCLSPMVDCLAECGWSRILIETVGAGQAEIRVVAFAERILLVDGPDRGDVIQAEKAGIIELADLIAINKSDLPNAARAADSIRSALSVGELERNPEVLLVSAHDGSGIEQLVDAIDAVETTTGRERLRIRERLISAWDSALLGADSFDEVIAALETGSMTLSEAVESIRKG